MEPRELIRLCKLWQKRLRLQDWKINIQFASAKVIEDITNYAGVVWSCVVPNALEMTAIIYMLHPSDRTDEEIEADVIHEELHLRLDKCGADGEDKETAINLLADALQAGFRRRKHVGKI